MPILPPKVIPFTLLSITPYAYWGTTETNDMSAIDPWSTSPYQWEVVLQIAPQTHSSQETPSAFSYDGNDIFVGMWIADITSGFAVKIVSIVFQGALNVDCIVEDVDRYNTFADPTQSGNGIGSTGQGFAFNLGVDGLPILAPISSLSAALNFNVGFEEDLISRFRYRNFITNNISVKQTSNNFAVGDQISFDGSIYSKVIATSSAVDVTIGTVTSINIPGADWFTFKPIGNLINLVVPGTPGSLVWISDSVAGGLVSTKPNSFSKPSYIKFSSTQAIQLDRSTDSAVVANLPVTVNTNGQTIFTLPSYVRTVLNMSVNGVETLNFTFTAPTLTFNAIAEGYNLESSDTVMVLYTN